MTESWLSVAKKKNHSSSKDVDISSQVDSICEQLSLHQPEHRIICRDILISHSLDIKRTIVDMRAIMQASLDDCFDDIESPSSLPDLFQSIYDQLVDGDLVQTKTSSNLENDLICETLFQGFSVNSLDATEMKPTKCHDTTSRGKSDPVEKVPGSSSGSKSELDIPWWQLGDTRTTQMVARDLVRDLFSSAEVSDDSLDHTLIAFDFDIEACVDYLCRGGPTMNGARRSFLDALTHNLRGHCQRRPPNAFPTLPGSDEQSTHDARSLHSNLDTKACEAIPAINNEWTTIAKKKGSVNKVNLAVQLVTSPLPLTQSKSTVKKSILNVSGKYDDSGSESPGRIKSNVEQELQEYAREMVNFFTRAHLAAQTRAGAPLAQYLASKGRETKRRFMHADATLALLALQKGNPDLRISLVESDTDSSTLGRAESVFLFEGKKRNQGMQEPLSRMSHASRKMSPQDLTCDLHGVNVRQGIRFLNAVVEYCRRSRRVWRLAFVVGRGLHSHRGAPQLGPRILTYLSSRGVKDAVLSNGTITFTL